MCENNRELTYSSRFLRNPVNEGEALKEEHTISKEKILVLDVSMI